MGRLVAQLETDLDVIMDIAVGDVGKGVQFLFGTAVGTGDLGGTCLLVVGMAAVRLVEGAEVL